MNVAKPLLVELDDPDSCLVYDTRTKNAFIRIAHPGASTRTLDRSVTLEDIIILFTNGWVTRSDGAGNEYHYRITEAGRKASRESNGR